MFVVLEKTNTRPIKTKVVPFTIEDTLLETKKRKMDLPSKSSESSHYISLQAMDDDPAKFEIMCSSNETSNDSSFLDSIRHPYHEGDTEVDEIEDEEYKIGSDFIAYPPIRK